MMSSLEMLVTHGQTAADPVYRPPLPSGIRVVLMLNKLCNWTAETHFFSGYFALKLFAVRPGIKDNLAVVDFRA